MADDDDLFDSQDDGDTDKSKQSSGGGLRAQLEKALADLKTEREARIKLEAENRQHTVNDVFAELKVPEKVRAFYTGEAERDKILAWVKDNADVFGLSPDTDDQEPDQRTDNLREVQKAASVGFDGANHGIESITRDIETKMKTGKLTERDIDEQLRKLFVR